MLIEMLHSGQYYQGI